MQADSKIIYKMDMRVCVNDHCAEGALVVPEAAVYRFDINARGKLDLFILTTCHRDIVLENAGRPGIFGNKKRVKYDLTPVPSMETDQYGCLVHLGGFERRRGRHSWAMVAFEHPSLTLKAQIQCNGLAYEAPGVSICQAKAGLTQQIRFSVPVIMGRKNACQLLTSKDGKVFQFDMPAGECVYRFAEKHGKKKHRMSTFGYEKVLLRDD